MSDVAVIIPFVAFYLFPLERGVPALEIPKSLMVFCEIIIRFLPRPSGKRRSFNSLVEALVAWYFHIPLSPCHIELVLLLFRFLIDFKSYHVILVFFVDEPFVLLGTLSGFINIWCFVALRLIFSFFFLDRRRFVVELLRWRTLFYSETGQNVLCKLKHLLWSACVSCDWHHSIHLIDLGFFTLRLLIFHIHNLWNLKDLKL